MPPIKLKLDRKFELVVSMVREYGYNDGPLCNNPGCESELSHLIDDWLNNANDLRTDQKDLDMSDEEFEKLLGAIYGADEIEYEESK